MEPGFLGTGGAVDSAFDVFRGSLGTAATSVQAWFKQRGLGAVDRYAVQRVMYLYASGVKAGSFPQFAGMNDPNAKRIVELIKSKVAFSEDFIYNVLYALFDLVSSGKANTSVAAVLAGDNGNILDGVLNAGPTEALTDTVNDVFKGLGLPSLANTVVILLVLAVIGAVVYFKVIRK